MARLEGKVALISGAARGLGSAQARRFVDEGARVILADILDDDGGALSRDLGPSARFQHLDVTRPDDWASAVNAAMTSFGRLDILVNNAGIAAWAPFEEHTVETWNRVIAVNLTGAFFGTQAVLPELKRSGGGSIINVSSAAGLIGIAGMASYTASKFGLRGLTKSTALELGRYDIRVNSVHPGRILTPLSTDNGIEALERQAIARRGNATEVADLVLFLASDESRYSTGSEFVVDGGMTAGTVPA